MYIFFTSCIEGWKAGGQATEWLVDDDDKEETSLDKSVSYTNQKGREKLNPL